MISSLYTGDTNGQGGMIITGHDNGRVCLWEIILHTPGAISQLCCIAYPTFVEGKEFREVLQIDFCPTSRQLCVGYGDGLLLCYEFFSSSVTINLQMLNVPKFSLSGFFFFLLNFYYICVGVGVLLLVFILCDFFNFF